MIKKLFDELSELAPIWQWCPRPNNWKKGFYSLDSISKKIKKYGSSWFSHLTRKERLGLYSAKADYKKNRLNREHPLIKELETIPGLDFFNYSIMDEIWLKKYEIIKGLPCNFIGRPIVPSKTIATFINSNRRLFPKMIEKRKHLLCKIPWWNDFVSPSFNGRFVCKKVADTFDKLCKVVEKNGISGIRKKDPLLYNFICKTKVSYRKGKLNDSVVKKLEAIPGWSWDTAPIRGRCISNKLEELEKRISNKSIKTIMDLRYDDYFATFLHRMSIRYKEKMLLKSVYERLEKLPGWFDYLNKKRKKGEHNPHFLKSFNAFKGRIDNGLSIEDIHARHEFYSFVVSNKKKYKKGLLTKTQIKMLNSIKGWSWGPRPWRRIGD